MMTFYKYMSYFVLGIFISVISGSASAADPSSIDQPGFTKVDNAVNGNIGNGSTIILLTRELNFSTEEGLAFQKQHPNDSIPGRIFLIKLTKPDGKDSSISTIGYIVGAEARIIHPRPNWQYCAIPTGMANHALLALIRTTGVDQEINVYDIDMSKNVNLPAIFSEKDIGQDKSLMAALSKRSVELPPGANASKTHIYAVKIDDGLVLRSVIDRIDGGASIVLDVKYDSSSQKWVPELSAEETELLDKKQKAEIKP